MTDPAGKIETRKIGDILVIVVPAGFSAEMADAFNSRIEWELADSPGSVIVDFTRHAQLDADNVEAFRFLFERMHEVGTPVIVAGASPGTQELLGLAGYLGHALMAASVQEAIDSGMA